MPSKIRAALDAKIDKWRHMRGSSGAGSNLGSAATLSPSPSSGPSPSPSPGPPPSSSPGPSSGPSPSPSPGPPPSPSPSPQSPGQSQVLLGRPPQLPVVVLSRVATIVTFSSEAIWDEAVQALSDDHRFALQKNNFTYPGTDCAIVKQAVKEKQIALERNSNSKRWASYSYTWRGRTYSLTKLLDNTIAWVDRFKTIGDIIAQYDPGHIALPWAAVRFLLQVVVEDKANMTAIALLLDRTTNVVAACSMYIELYLHLGFDYTELLKESLVKLYTELLSSLALAIGYFDRHFRAVRSLLDDRQFENSLDQIDKLMGRVRELVQIAQGRVQESAITWQRDMFMKLQQNLIGLDSSVASIGLTTDELQRDMEDKNRDAFLEWLSPCQQEKHHLDAGEGILENTGKWLFEQTSGQYQPWHKQFVAWQACQDSTVLWLKGDPGVGKTRLTHAGIERERRRAPPVIYFYCSRGDNERRRPETILGTLVKELLLCHGVSTPQALRDRYHARKEKGGLRIQELQEWLVQLLEQCKRTSIFIDAIDEILPQRRYLFLETLSALSQNPQFHVRIWVSSRRYEKEIRHTFPTADEILIDKQNLLEIRDYVMREVTNHIASRRLLDGAVDDVLKTHIIDTISEKSDGMFLWAHLQIINLCRLHRVTYVQKRLESLPRDLEQTYDTIYKMICEEDPADCETAMMALRWVMCAVRPLSPDEWVHAAWLSSTFMHNKAEERGIVQDSLDLNLKVMQKICHNFVSIDKQLNVVRFIHLSVREYLEKKVDFMKIQPDWMAANTTLAYLSHSKSITGAFSKYVIDNWSVHCNLVTQSLDAGVECPLKPAAVKIQQLVRKFLRPCDAYERWLSQVNEAEFCMHIDPLFVAARYGMAQICKEILSCPQQTPIPVNTEHRTPLHAAAQHGHEKVVALYLERPNVQEIVNNQDKDGRTALAWAVFGGHQPVVELLLSCPQVDVNLVDKVGGFSPLTRAAWRGNESMVGLLVEAEKIDIDRKDDRGRTPLMWAARRGDIPVMSALMNQGADANDCDEFGRTALHWALISKELDAFERLTQHPGVDVNCRDANGMTPLFYACKYREGPSLERTVRRLLAVEGVDVNCPELNTTPLHLAADAKQHAVVRLLVPTPDLRINEVDVKGRTALIVATLNGDKRCVRAILMGGSRVELRHEDATGRTALIHAVEKVVEEMRKEHHDTAKVFYKIVTELLKAEDITDLGRPVNFDDLAGNTMLDHWHEDILAHERTNPSSRRATGVAGVDATEIFQLAQQAMRGNTEAHQRLLQVDINARNVSGETALHLAVRFSKRRQAISIVKILFGIPGIEPDLQDLWLRTPLIEAARAGNASILEILLDNPQINPNHRDSRGRSALFLCTRDKLKRVVELLVKDPRVDINAIDNNGVTPISQAVHNSAAEIADVILSTGRADVNRLDNLGFSALTYAAQKGELEVLNRLLQVEGIDIESMDDRGYTAVALASKYGHKKAVGVLVAHGASLVAKTNKGLTPLDLAQEHGHMTIVELLNNAE